MKLNSSFDIAANHWQNPSRNSDARSSGNGLLCIAYGSLEKAARNHWNDEQPFISDSDLAVLLHCCKATQSPEEIKSALNTFIQNSLQDDWAEYDDLTHSQRQKITINLVNTLASSVLKESAATRVASQLLFLLCPQLPVFPVIHDKDIDGISYQEFYLQQKQNFTLALPSLDQSCPLIHYGDSNEQDIIRKLLQANNWWQRYLFIHS
ncbi:hypothetical protein [Aliamphritea spongicola]|uniref:hypothetical protein n=1 Tax=Aliamphritea spongicola TaxID=707589 RepID=UPI00196B9709|nr:hypothetical protein [Aliamphritea spongicola]MBN3563102.1 hypothetical protein [Aliamphritea spongicola]